MIRRGNVKRALTGFLLLTGVAALYWWFTPGRTPSIRMVHSIASLERYRLGGVDQSVLIRGDDVSHPVLLFLHGGPGMPAMYLAHTFQADLEREFVVVHWDRRGAGKSYRPDLGPTLTSEQLFSDAVEMTEALRERFHQDRIYLVGHSWGTYLGMLLISRRADLYRAYVGIGQLARSAPMASIQDAFIVQQAKARNDQSALRQMAAEPGSARENLLFRYGGELHRSRSYTPLLFAGLSAPEYSFRDVLNVPKGVSLYSRFFVYNSLEGELMDVVTSVQVPVYFFTGRYDYTDPFVLTEQYFARLGAPAKRLVWFEESAHFPFFEEPGEFARRMTEVVRETRR